MRLSVQTFLSPFCFLGVVKVTGLLIAECLSVRYLILQYSLTVHCMYVSHALECNYSCGDLRHIIDDH